VLSPLLSNLFLDDLDRELQQRGHRFVRYADDCNIYLRSERAGQRVMGSVRRFITKKLKLKVNEKKSAVDKPSRRKFLGFSFTHGKAPRRKLAPQSIVRFRAKVRDLTRRGVGRSLGQVVADLQCYLNGWLGYYGYTQLPRQLGPLESWLRRRLRSFIWTQWKTYKKRLRALRSRGVYDGLARKTAASSKGSWRIAHSQAIQIALPNAYFRELGIPPFIAQGVA